jgi:hypothetical protein
VRAVGATETVLVLKVARVVLVAWPLVAAAMTDINLSPRPSFAAAVVSCANAVVYPTLLDTAVLVLRWAMAFKVPLCLRAVLVFASKAR